MLSYRHAYHAGNPADVFKHTVLVALVRALQQKPGGICYIDTHAGPGWYDLQSAQAQQNREFAAGIGALWPGPAPEGPIRDYLALVRAFNPDDRLQAYPGSPSIVRRLLRKQDRMVLCELHTSEQSALARRFAGDRRVYVHAGDGYRALRRFLPPPGGRRALVLIDPAYEIRTELTELSQALASALRRLGHGCYAIWYPVIEGRELSLDRLPELLGLRPEHWLDLRVEWTEAQRLGRMTGCGMAIIHCPYRARALLEGLSAAWPWSGKTDPDSAGRATNRA